MTRTRRWAALAIATLCWLALTASGASAASETTNCAGLQAALNQANSGDVITLDQLCTATNSGSSAGAFTLGSGNSQPSYTLQGKPGSGAGFDGTGVAGSMLSATGNNSLTTYTIKDLLFENGSPARPTNDGGAAISLAGYYDLAVEGDTFTNNRISGPNLSGGAIYLDTSASSGSITLTNSSFHGNAAPDGGGAVSIIEFRASAPSVNISDDTFTSNAVTGPWPEDIAGGALDIGNYSGQATQLSQSGNTFSGNSVNGGSQDAFGGAEATFGMNDSLTRDLFTGNSIQAPTGRYFSEGSALSIFNDTCQTTLSHTLTDVAIAGNSITDGATNPSHAWGALYVGVECSGPNKLTLINSTISANRGGGGTAGIWGDPKDQLTLKNSILNGDSDGAELTGFNGSGGSLTVTYSDLCNGSSPWAGSGNICAAPKLADPASGDVHETYPSPTIDAGSNALVPGALHIDLYGKPRIQPKLAGHKAIVDMGAAEFPTIGPPKVRIKRPAKDATYTQGQVVHSHFTCIEAPRGPGIASCRTRSGRKSGQLINTSTLGIHHFKVIATSRDGLTASKIVSYTVKARAKRRRPKPPFTG